MQLCGELMLKHVEAIEGLSYYGYIVRTKEYLKMSWDAYIFHHGLWTISAEDFFLDSILEVPKARPMPVHRFEIAGTI